jgi:hypothetical protein
MAEFGQEIMRMRELLGGIWVIISIGKILIVSNKSVVIAIRIFLMAATNKINPMILIMKKRKLQSLLS